MKDNSCILAASNTITATGSTAWLDLANTDNTVPMRFAVHVTFASATVSDCAMRFQLEHSADGVTTDGVIAEINDMTADEAAALTGLLVPFQASLATNAITPKAYNGVFATPFQYVRLTVTMTGGTTKTLTYESYIAPTVIGEA